MKIESRWTFSIFVFVITFVVYVITCAPDVMFTDNGELAGACATLGIAHPTGYPLFTILGHLWTLLPLPFSTIYSLNLFAAFVTAASGMVFFNVAFTIFEQLNEKSAIKPAKQDKRKAKKKAEPKKPVKLTTGNILMVSLGAALAYSFAATVWEQGTSLEVYSLQLLLMNLILLTFLNGIFTGSNKYLILSAFLIGLGFSNHMTTILLLPAILFMYFKRPGKKFDFSGERWKFLALLILPLLLGLSFYIYMPIRSAGLPEFNWGWVHRGFDKFMYHVQGKQYQVWMFSGSESWSKNFTKFSEAFPYQLGWIGIIPFLLGIGKLFKLSKETFWFVALLLVVCFVYSMNYSIHDIEVYFLTAFAAAIIFAGAGFYWLAQKMPKILPVIFIVPLVSLVMNFQSNGQSDNYLVAEYTDILLENLEEDAIVISAQWDYWCSAFWYKKHVEGMRPDVTLIEKELMRRTWYPHQLLQWNPELREQCKPGFDSYMRDLQKFEADETYDRMSIQSNFVGLLNCYIDENFGKRPVYLTIDLMQTEKEVGQKYAKVPEGFTYRLREKGKKYDVSLDNLDMKKFIASLEGQSGHLVDGIQEIAAVNVANIGSYALYTGDRDKARKAFNLALEIDPENEYAMRGLRQINR